MARKIEKARHETKKKAKLTLKEKKIKKRAKKTEI